MADQVPQRVKDIVRMRAHAACERCGGPLDGWDGHSYHHRRIKGMGGDKRPETNEAANILLLCGSGTTSCHGYVHSAHGAQAAREAGWLLSRYLIPTDVPVRLYRHGYVYLNDSGTIVKERDDAATYPVQE